MSPEQKVADLDQKIGRIARRVARRPEDVDDAEQAARVAVWEAATEHGDTVGEGFLVQRAKWAAQNEAARLHRQRHDALSLDNGLEHVLPELFHDDSPARVDPADVHAAVDRLNVRARSVIEHRYFAPATMPTRTAGFQPNTHGLSVRVTAKNLRLKPSEVRTAERRALGLLRKDLAGLTDAA